MVNSIKLISNNIAHTYGTTSKDMIPTISVRGYAPPVVNSETWMTRIRKTDEKNKILKEKLWIFRCLNHSLCGVLLSMVVFL